MATPQNPQIAAALEKAQAKRELAERLLRLPVEARRDVLADLLVDVAIVGVGEVGSPVVGVLKGLGVGNHVSSQGFPGFESLSLR